MVNICASEDVFGVTLICTLVLRFRMSHSVAYSTTLPVSHPIHCRMFGLEMNEKLEKIWKDNVVE
jgi:hypothetical protein